MFFYYYLIYILEMSGHLFGYVIPFKPEMKIREYDIFKSYYCGLCKELGSNYNQLTRFGLSYDFTFLSLLLSSLREDKDNVTKENCIAHVFKKQNIIKGNRELKYCADMSIILYYLKLIDDVKDDHSIKAFFLSLIYYLPYRKAKKKHNIKYLRIKKLLDNLSCLEKDNCNIIDMCAHNFGSIVRTIFQPEYIKDKDSLKILGWMGYNLGRWVYILDAYNDMEDDIKHNNYNPIICQYGTDEYGSNETKTNIEFILTYTLENVAKSFDLLNIKRNKCIIENIIFLGTRNIMENILYKGEERNEESI